VRLVSLVLFDVNERQSFALAGADPDTNLMVDHRANEIIDNFANAGHSLVVSIYNDFKPVLIKKESAEHAAKNGFFVGRFGCRRVRRAAKRLRY